MSSIFKGVFTDSSSVNNVMIIIFIILLIIVVVIIRNEMNQVNETIMNIGPYSWMNQYDEEINDDQINGRIPYGNMNTMTIGKLSRLGLLPWWNSTRFTRNMSYDIRGEPRIISSQVGPWLNSPIID